MLEIATTWLSGAAVLLAAYAIDTQTETDPTGKQPDLESMDLERADDNLVDLLESESDTTTETGGEVET